MQVFIGLGNPGEQYQKNRHNAGFIFVDLLAQKFELNFEPNKYIDSLVAQNDKVILIKPQTFMNHSGEAVKKATVYYSLIIDHLFVVHDDLDIKLGDYKIQKGVGPKLHNGINSIESQLSSDQFWRIRIGVDNRSSENRIAGDVYSLQNFSTKELEVIHNINVKIIKELKIK